MSESVCRLDLTKIPFGRPCSAIMIYEEDNSDGSDFKPGLYFLMLVQGGAPRRKGLVDLEPVAEGKPLKFTYKAAPDRIEMKTEKGNVTVCIDTPRTVRIRGEGVGIRLYTKIPFMTMENATMLPGGLADLNLMSINNDGGRFFFKAIKGSVTLDSFFNVSKNGPEDAKIEFLPDEEGVFEVAGYVMNPDEWGYIDYKSVGDCAEAVLSDYEAFEKQYPQVGAEWEAIRALSIYAIWLHRQGKNDREIIPTIKGELIYSDYTGKGWASMYEQPLHAMAMKDTQKAAELIKNAYLHMTEGGMLPATVSTFKTHYQASPPTFGAAIVDILKKTDGKLDKADALELYGAMSKNYDWWKQSHSFAPGRFCYNHRDEMMLPGTSYGALEFPLETPELYALMILHIEAIIRLGEIAGGENTETWKTEQKAVTQELIKLWDGDAFVCRGALSGKTFKSGSLLACLPVILGKRLPEEITDKLIKRLGAEDMFLSERGFRSESKESEYYSPTSEGRGAIVSWLQQLIISGLLECGAEDLMKKAASGFLKCAEENGARDVFCDAEEQPARRPGGYINPIAGAAVIYIAAKLYERG